MSRRALVTLVIGGAAWMLGAALTPGELAAAKRHEPLSPRTAVALIAFLGGAIGVLTGLAPPAPRR